MNGKRSQRTSSVLFAANAVLLFVVLFFAKCGEDQPIGVGTPNTYTVKYEANGATGGVVPDAQTKYENYPLPIAPNSGALVKDSCAFYGWNTQADGSGTTYAENTIYVENADLTLYVMWKQAYTVTYMPNGATGGNVPETQEKVQDSALVLASNSGNLVKEGYVFAGWNTDSLGAGIAYESGAADTVNASLTLYAMWSPTPTYAVTYNANGAASGTAPSPQTKVEDVALILASNSGVLTKTGYNFGGWNTDSLGTGKAYDECAKYVINADLHLYAVWTLVPTYTVTYDKNGADVTGTVPAAQTKVEGKPLLLSDGETLARADYTFVGWNTSADGTGKAYDGGVKYVTNAAATLYAIWSLEPSYTVTYAANGATAGTAPLAQKMDVGEPAILASAQSMSKENHIFAGWNTDSLGTGTAYESGIKYTENKDITLYATWKRVYKVVYNANENTSGIVPATQVKIQNEPLVLASNSGVLAKKDYSFAGWNTKNDGTGTVYSEGATDTVNANMMLYAMWTKKPVYKVIYKPNGATTGSEFFQTKVEDVPLSVPGGESLTKEKYDFVGWNTDSNGTGTAYEAGTKYIANAEITLYAIWSLIPTYTVTYDANKGTGTVPKGQAEEKGKPVYLSGGESLARADYKFTGWNTKQTGDGQFYDAGVKYTANETVTLYAVWTPIPKYTVTYYANGGSGAVPASQTKVEDVSLRLSNKGNLSLADHVFIGWNTLANGNGVTYFVRDLYTENAKLDLYAMWRKNDAQVFAITYDGNGATSGTPPSDQPKVEDAIVTLATKGSLAKDGHIFIGWNTQADGKGTSYAESAKYTANDDLTLYAMWQESSGAQTYIVTYNANGGTGTVPEAQTKTEGVYLAVKDKGDLANGEFVFTGWNTRADGTGTFYAEGANYIANEAATLYAMWMPVFKVTYDANVPEGSVKTGAVPAEQIKVTGVDLELNFENTLAITGFALVGWKDATGTNYPQNSYYRKDANVTLKAQWKKSYTVKYNANGGTGVVPDAQIKVQGEALYLDFSNNLVNANNAFTGWNTEKDGTGENYGWIENGRWKAVYRADSNITLYANWIQSYTVTYHANEAITGTVPASQVKTKGVPLTLVGNTGNLGREGFVFDGWNTEPDGTGTTYEVSSDYWYNEILSTYTADANVTLYVKWKQTYTVNFDPNGGTGSVPNSLIKKHGESIRFEDCENLTKTGYVFGGWNESSDGSGKNYGWNGHRYDYWYTSYSDDANIILYAEWKPTYTVTYDGNGATKGTVPVSQEKIEGVQLTLAGNSGNLTKDDGIFGGWNTQADGKGTDYVANSSYNADAKVTLYVKWVPSYTITYDGNGATKGTVPVSQEKIEGVQLTLAGNSGNLTKDDGIFGGWNTQADGKGTDYVANSSYNADAKVTLYVKWVPSYTITYDGNGATKGTVPNQQVKGHGEEIKLDFNVNLFKDDSAFGGWNTNVDGTGTLYGTFYTDYDGVKWRDVYYGENESVTLYVKWKPTFTVTYNANDKNARGNVPVSQKKTQGFPLKLNFSNSLDNDGFMLDGWEDESGNTYTNGQFYVADSNITLYAQWKLFYTVTYDLNGASYGKTPESVTKLEGENVQLASPQSWKEDNNFGKDGYIFAGWNTQKDGTGTNYGWNEERGRFDEEIASYSDDADITLYANWKPDYTVTYNLNGGSCDEPVPDPETKKYGQRLVLWFGENLVKVDGDKQYAFAGWNTKDDGTGTDYGTYQADWYGNGSWGGYYSACTTVTLYAQWTQVYTVTYNDNVDDAEITVPAAVTKKSGEEFNLDFNVGSREGFTFAGWKDVASGTIYGTWNHVWDSWEGTFTIGNSNVTLDAVWKPDYTISYNVNGGTGEVVSETRSYNDYLKAVGGEEYRYPSIISGSQLMDGSKAAWSPKEGHSFVGWSTDQEATVADPIYAQGSRYKTYANLTLYAVWQETE